MSLSSSVTYLPVGPDALGALAETFPRVLGNALRLLGRVFPSTALLTAENWILRRTWRSGAASTHDTHTEHGRDGLVDGKDLRLNDVPAKMLLVGTEEKGGNRNGKQAKYLAR